MGFFVVRGRRTPLAEMEGLEPSKIGINKPFFSYTVYFVRNGTQKAQKISTAGGLTLKAVSGTMMVKGVPTTKENPTKAATAT